MTLARIPVALLLLPVVALVSPLGACAPAEPDPTPPRDAGTIVSEIAPVRPTGQLTGLVVDAFTGAPLADVEVVVLALAENATATTDADGRYSLEGVPASTQIAVEYRLDSHFPARDLVTIPSSAGNLAQENGVAFSGPIGLLPRPDDAAYTPDVIVREDDNAVIGDVSVRAVLEVGWLRDGGLRGSLVATVGEGANGVFAIADLPDFAALATVAPGAVLRVVAVPADAQLRPTVREVTVQQAISAGGVLVDLIGPGGDDGVPALDLAVVDSNVQDLLEATLLPSVLPVDGAVTVTFNTTVDEASFFATASDSRGDTLPTSWSVSDDTATVTITGARSGEDVYVLVEAFAEGFATGSDGNVTTVRADGFFVTDSAVELKLRAYEAAFNNNRLVSATDGQTPVCLYTANTKLYLELDAPVGARRPNGNPVPVDELMPLRVTSAFAPAGHPMHPDFEGGSVVGRVIDPGVGLRRSGFSGLIEVDWVPFPTPGSPTATSPFQMQMSLIFNDASLGGSDAVIVRRADGSPVGQSDTPQVNFSVAICP